MQGLRCTVFIIGYLTDATNQGQDTVQNVQKRLLHAQSQLEMLEDKLRELRLLALDPREYDDKTVTLSQLDSLRRELIMAARNNLKFVEFGSKVCASLDCMHGVQAQCCMRMPGQMYIARWPPATRCEARHCLCRGELGHHTPRIQLPSPVQMSTGPNLPLDHDLPRHATVFSCASPHLSCRVLHAPPLQSCYSVCATAWCSPGLMDLIEHLPSVRGNGRLTACWKETAGACKTCHGSSVGLLEAMCG